MAEPSKNLMIARAPVSVWDKRCGLSAYDQERWIMAAWGTGLAMLGARRGGFFGGLLATFGASMAMRAAMGHHDYRVARNWVQTSMGERGWGVRRDIVDYAAEDSFPASDSPSWTADIGTARR